MIIDGEPTPCDDSTAWFVEDLRKDSEPGVFISAEDRRANREEDCGEEADHEEIRAEEIHDQEGRRQEEDGEPSGRAEIGGCRRRR